MQRRHLDGSDSDRIPAATLMIEVDGIDRFPRKKRREKILDQVAWVIGDTIRGTDTVFRHGEDGFMVVLTHTAEAAAMAAADRIRTNVSIMPLLREEGVTVSIAVAPGTDDDLAGSIERAERAIGHATENNQIVRAEPGN